MWGGIKKGANAVGNFAKEHLLPVAIDKAKSIAKGYLGAGKRRARGLTRGMGLFRDEDEGAPKRMRGSGLIDDSKTAQQAAAEEEDSLPFPHGAHKVPEGFIRRSDLRRRSMDMDQKDDS